MAKYDMRTVGSNLNTQLVVPDEKVDPCREGHIWDLNGDPGAPLECMICGAKRGPMSAQDLRFLRDNLLIAAGKDPEHG